ncbi:MAG: DsrE family protein [Cyclobacteriaceae bacterium]|nr:DsrE family protein [Cyclobacteriaceae bacterium]
MKKGLWLVIVVITYALPSAGQVVDMKKHKIVMQFSVGDSTEQASLVGQVGNIRSAWPNATVEVVCHSSGLDILTKAKSKVAASIKDLSSQGVIFAACNNTMRRRNIKKEDLLEQAVVVPSAMIELVSKQESGWSYLKGAH